MQAITTKYIGPTNFKDSRIKATAAGGMTHTMSYDPALNADENHFVAAYQLALKLKWTGKMIQGSIKGGYAHVFTEGAEEMTIK